MKVSYALRSAPLVALAALAAGTPAAAGDGIQTRLTPGSPWATFRHARPFMPGEEVRCASTCRVDLVGGTHGHLSVGARVKGAEAREMMSPSGKVKRLPVIRVTRGLVSLARRGPGHVAVMTPSGTIVVMGAGMMHVRVDRRTTVIAPRDAEAWRLDGFKLRKLHNAVYTVRGRKVQVRSSLPSPTWDVDPERMRPLALAVGGADGRVALAWNLQQAAAGYRVEVSSDPSFVRDVHRADLAGSASSHALSLPVGSYHARVTARDDQGFFSVESKPRKVDVVAVGGLRGGALIDGQLLLPEGVTVALPPAFQMGASATGPWTHVAPLRARKRPYQLWLRHGSGGAPFWIGKRTLRATATIHPANPVWPRDDLRVKVAVVDPTGRQAVDSIEPRLSVDLDGSPIDAKWVRKGGTFEARIPGRSVPQPSLVAVTVRDQFDHELGTTFVEVIGG